MNSLCAAVAMWMKDVKQLKWWLNEYICTKYYYYFKSNVVSIPSLRNRILQIYWPIVITSIEPKTFKTKLRHLDKGIDQSKKSHQQYSCCQLMVNVLGAFAG